MHHEMMRLPAMPGASDRIGDVLASIRQLIAQDAAGCRLSDATLNAVSPAVPLPGPGPEVPCLAPLMLDRSDLVTIRPAPLREMQGPLLQVWPVPAAGDAAPAEPQDRSPVNAGASLPDEPLRGASPDAPPLAQPTEEETMLHANASVTPITAPMPELPLAAEAQGRDNSEVHLFAPDEKTAQKGTHLRGMIREAIRQELQGEIGNRLSRNLQAMIRQEVELTLRQMCEQD
ncbi:hypothetical protein [Paracoccus sp. (in: a-proteobacteria)]|uniref:hypothetical protein n=1 Tax=Paracoccus sp. TaxID=267 RepID=UPI00321F7FB8